MFLRRIKQAMKINRIEKTAVSLRMTYLKRLMRKENSSSTYTHAYIYTLSSLAAHIMKPPGVPSAMPPASSY